MTFPTEASAKGSATAAVFDANLRAQGTQLPAEDPRPSPEDTQGSQSSHMLAQVHGKLFYVQCS